MRVVRKQPSLKLKQQSLGVVRRHTRSPHIIFLLLCSHLHVDLDFCVCLFVQCHVLLMHNFNFKFFFIDFGLFLKFLLWKETHIKSTFGKNL
jgi:hypothetical protein